MQLLNLILALAAYRALLSFDASVDLAREAEEFFFVADDTSPLVVVLLVGWLLYRRRGSLSLLIGRARAPLIAGGFLLAASGVFVWAMLTQGVHLLALSLSLLIFGVAALYAGLPGLRAVALPALLLLFAIPIPGALRNHVLYAFQIGTANWAGALLALAGYPAYVSGDQILLAEQDFAVIEGCSGLRSVQTLSMIALLLSDLFGRRGLHAVLVVAAAPLIAFALNGLRVIALMLNPHSELVAIHNLQGVAILLVGLALLYGLDGLLERLLGARSAAAPPAAEEAPEADSGERAQADGASSPGLVPTALVSALLTALLACTGFVTPWATPVQLRPPPSPGTLVPDEIGEWHGEALRFETGFLESVRYREMLARRYQRADASVDLAVVVAPVQQRFYSALSPKLGLPGSGWQLEESGIHLLAANGPEVEWRLLRKGTRRVLVNLWREGALGVWGQSVAALLALDASPWRAEGEMVSLRLQAELAIPTRGERERAQALLDGFYAELGPELAALRRSAAGENP